MSEEKPPIEIKDVKKEPPKDYKVAEIWIKDGTVQLDASPAFWNDKLRALGILDYCKEIVKEFKVPEQKNRIIQAGTQMYRNFLKNGFRKHRR